ncbi:MAG: hypothetical protein EG823_08840 [Actinobacteria bacterium]|nr:hypothetical protein [Actinomycetota bacterium]
MSDELTSAPVPPSASADKKSGFLATSTGKIVAIVVGLGVLGIIAGVAVAIVLYVFGSQAVDQLEELAQQPATSTSGEATSTAGADVPAPAAELPNSEIFTFRDIFVPLLKPLTAATTTGTSTGTTDTVTPTSSNTLYLDGVVTENGVLMAQLRWNGTSYSLAAGGTIPNSPWQVLRVSSTSVTMLYGDTQVTLSVGQGITK